jgi:hypothetical protein
MGAAFELGIETHMTFSARENGFVQTVFFTER